MPPHQSDPELLVLQTLRLKGFVDADVVAAACTLPEALVDEVLDRLATWGLVTRRDGRIRGWTLTNAGRAEGERRLSDELDQAGCRATVDAAYSRFVTLNDPFLECCTRWQLREVDGSFDANQHDDGAYDESIIAELDRLDDSVQAVCSQLASALARFGYYNGRFAVARLRVHDGEHDWFAKPMIDSYHAVWFELHENLLATLNLERGRELDSFTALDTALDNQAGRAT
jgi:hypothetical protein